MDIEDSDEEQGLQANIFNEISSPSTQAKIMPTLSKEGPLEQPTTEQPTKHTADAQPEQMVAGHITNDQPEQLTTEKTTFSSTTEPLEPSSAEQIAVEPAITIKDLPKIEDLPSTPLAS